SLPFSGGTPAETVIQRIVRAPPSLAKARPDLPRWLHALSDRLLKVNPSHRFASAREVLRAVDTQRVPRAPLNRRALYALLAIVAALGAGGLYFWKHPVSLRELVAPIVPATPRLAVMPFTAATDDAELTALARAFEEHLREWLRSDATSAVISRPRVGDAIARTVPDLSGEAVVRQIPAIARAANASRVLRADLRRADGGLLLDLVWIDADGEATSHSIPIKGADAAALFVDYTNAMPPALRALDFRIGMPPALSPAALPAFGRGLLARDKHESETAANELTSITDTKPPSAIVDVALLAAQDDAHQDLPAQNTRDAALKQFAQDQSPAALGLRARAQIETNESDAALAGLEQAVKAYPHDPPLLLQYAETLAANGKGAEAMDVLKALVKADDQDARAWFLLGRTAIMQGQAQAAADDYLIRAVTLNRRSRNVAAEAETHNAIGAAFDQLGQLEYAATEYALAATMREKLGDTAGEAKSLRNLAISQATKGDHAAAEQTLDKVKGLLETLGDRGSLADLYNDRGVVAEEQGDYTAALAAYREALAIRQQIGDPTLIAESYNNVGYAAFQLGQLDNAFAFWQQAESLYKQLDDVSRALRIEQSMGLLDMARGHFTAARERMQASLRDAENHQLPEEAAAGSLNLAELALTEGRTKDSLDGAQRALEMFTRSSLLRGQIEANLVLARTFIALGDGAKAEAALNAVPSAEISNEQRAIFLLAAARSATLANDRTTGAAKLKEAEKVATDAHAGVVAFRVLLEKARQQLAVADIPGATATLAALRADTTLLGQVPLRAELIELEIAALVRGERKRDATARYREALPLLRDMGSYAHATTLHEVGAGAFAADSAEARAALEAAAAARKQLLADAPADAKGSLERQLALRIQQETGVADAN
ncbi:MAG: tetratricopeptide repeat protein, partial [Rhodanobacteraceae bacterium]